MWHSACVLTIASIDLSKGLKHLHTIDPGMVELTAVHGVPSLKRTRNAFASLGRAIIFQQLSGRAAQTIYTRFRKLFPGSRFPTPDRLLQASKGQLRSVGISQQKATYLLDLASKFADGTIRVRRFGRLSNEALAAELTQIKGVGQWSVDMFLLFGLNRPDVLPVGDLGIRKGMQRYFGCDALPKPPQMVQFAAPWSPFRSLASWYMWRVAGSG